MKKIFLLSICLLSLTTFSSCSSSDDEIFETPEITLNSETIVGEWTDFERGCIYFFIEDCVEIRNNLERVIYKWHFTNDSIVFAETEINDKGKTHTYHYYGYIISKSLYDLVFELDGEIYKLHRTSKHESF